MTVFRASSLHMIFKQALLDYLWRIYAYCHRSGMLVLLMGLWLLSSTANAAQVNLLNSSSVSAMGAGATGTPNLSNFNIPAGKNRVLFIFTAFERDHCDQISDTCMLTTSGAPVTGLSDNYSRVSATNQQITARVIGSSATINKQNALVVGGSPSGDTRFSWLESSLKDQFGVAIPNSALFTADSYHIALFESEINSLLGGASTGTVSISLPDMPNPKSTGDDALIMAFVLENADQTATGLVRSALPQLVSPGTGIAGNYTLNAASFDAGQAPNDANDGLLVIGVSSLGQPANPGGFLPMAGYTQILSLTTSNANGRYDNSEPTWTTTEPDGFSASAQFRNGIVSNYTLQSAAASSVIAWGGWAPAFTISSDNADTSDAPSSYGNPTHNISGIRLGASVDADAALLANATATGDDSNGTDDENGVTMPTLMTVGVTSTVPVTIQSAAGYLNAWFDWNQDGDFLDSGEQVTTDLSVAVGIRNLSVAVPSNAVTGTTFARFRVCSSTAQCNTPNSVALSGEVEDYTVNMTIPPDYSDAPASYGTPSHTIVTGIQLGTIAPDSEVAAQPNAAANGDGADEDGITLPTLTQGQSATITATVTGAGGYLQGWIDFNDDGDFADAGEQVASNIQDNVAGDTNNTAGTIAFNINVPNNAATTQTYARFRWSTMMGLNATTAATNGEVEDYTLTINMLGSACAAVPVTTLSNALVNANNEYILTQDVNNQSGFIWSNEKIDLNQPFDIELGVYLGSNVGIDPGTGLDRGADGMSFILQNDPRGTAAQGYIGGFMGVDGDINLSAYGYTDRAVYPSVTVEFDTFDNTFMGFTGDLAADHTAIYLNGDVAIPDAANTLKAATSVGIGGEIEDGKYHLTRYIWNPTTQTLTYYFDSVLIASVSRDLISYFGSNYVTFGFSAATGASKNLQKACWIKPPAMVTPITNDYSDAPTTYGTPNHTIVAGVSLGTAPDAESAASTPLNGTGDDATGTDDEDGVTLQVLTQGQTATITATVTGTGGYLQGWIDWNGNGSFADAGEQIATNLQDNVAGDINANAGTLAFNVAVPANAVTTQTYARFRWSTIQNLDTTTAAANGEVEDYALTVLAQFEPALPSSVCTMNAYGWLDTHTPLSGGGEANPPYSLVTGSYDWDTAGNPIWKGSSTPTQSSLGATVNTTLAELDLTDSSTGQNEAWMTITRLEGNSGSTGTAIIQDGGALEHKVFLITDAVGNVLTRYPSAASTSTDTAVTPPGERNLSGLALNFTYPSDGVAYVHIYVVDYSTYREVPYIASCLKDFGDAPATYGSPAHSILKDIQLGATAPDIDAAPQSNTAANGDDTAGTDDEDGVTLPTEFNSSQLVAVSVEAVGAGGKLQTWIDWNGDGDFADAGEQIAKNAVDNAGIDTDATAGVITFNVTPPATAKAGTTYARFRWSTQSNLTATAAANDGEVEDYAVTIAANGTPLSIAGRVFNDVNVNGVDNNEAALKEVVVVLHDLTTNTCQSMKTAADGGYQFDDLVAGDYVVYEAVGAKVPTPSTCPPTAKDPNGFVSSTANALTITLSTTAVNDADFGDVKTPTFSLDNSKAILPNSTVTYPHVFQTFAAGNVLFNLDSAQADPADLTWGATLFLDTNCDAKLGQGDTPITAPLAVNAGDKLCILTKVAAPADAPTGALHVLTVSSDFHYGDASLIAASHIQTHTDRTQTSAGTNPEEPTKPISGSGKLSLEKSVWNITRNIEGSVALPGETLRYTIYYENIGNGLLNELAIQDSVPEFTQLVPASMACGATPPELSACSPQVSGNSLSWAFTGQLKAGSTGEVSYDVTVE